MRARVAGTVLGVSGDFAELAGCTFDGYEIHMGVSRLAEGAEPLLAFEDGTAVGAAAGNVCGSYIHGVFDGQIAPALARMLLARKGLDPDGVVELDTNAYKEQQYDKLADGIREHLDMEKIYQILGLPGPR